jgi:hypothetical protein
LEHYSASLEPLSEWAVKAATKDFKSPAHPNSVTYRSVPYSTAAAVLRQDVAIECVGRLNVLVDLTATTRVLTMLQVQ